MKKSLLLLLGVAFACNAAAVHAAGKARTPAFLDRIGAVATAKVNTAHVSVGRGMELTARLDDDGRLAAVRVSRSSGTPEADRAMAHALHGLAVGAPPPDLAGAELTLSVGAARMVQAKAP